VGLLLEPVTAPAVRAGALEVLSVVILLVGAWQLGRFLYRSRSA
jgi:hypothetical protein